MNRIAKRLAESPLEGNDKRKNDEPTPTNSMSTQPKSPGSRVARAAATSEGRTLRLDPALLSGEAGIYYGRMRTIIEVEILEIDKKPYTTNIHEDEAFKLVYKQGLELDRKNLIGINCQWRGNPIINFRLRNPVYITKLPETFEYGKKENMEGGLQRIMVVKGIVKGVKRPEEYQNRQKESNSVWVRLENIGWKLTHNQIKHWLECYGTLESEVEETKFGRDDSEDEDDDDEPDFGRGNYSVKVRLDKRIPQYLPMFGMKIKIYYRGIAKMCTNCYKTGHIQKDCDELRVSWIEYVTDFINNNEDIPEGLFGRWMKIATNWYKINHSTNSDTEVFKDAIQSPPPTQTTNPEPTKGEPAKRGRKKKT